MVLFVQKLFSKARQARLDAEKEIQIAAQELLDVQQVRHKIEVEGIVLHRVASCCIVFHRVSSCFSLSSLSSLSFFPSFLPNTFD